jgi:hypothetical protein
MVRCSRRLDRRRIPALGNHSGLGSCRRLMVAVADWPSDRPVARYFRMQQGRRYCPEIGAGWLFWRGRMGEGDCRESYSPRACFYPRGIGGCHLPHGSRIRRSLRGRRRRILPQTHNPWLCSLIAGGCASSPGAPPDIAAGSTVLSGVGTPVHPMMALGASASQCCKRSRPRLARSNRARGMTVASTRQRYHCGVRVIHYTGM